MRMSRRRQVHVAREVSNWGAMASAAASASASALTLCSQSCMRTSCHEKLNHRNGADMIRFKIHLSLTAEASLAICSKYFFTAAVHLSGAGGATCRTQQKCHLRKELRPMNGDEGDLKQDHKCN